ncbi:GNAT family N-acetyltransferase [Cryobacterium sp. LW097]|uniref:GNAT family N-acetyltransferase n=1 Tax=unclassified Cryobacterium TaxID=2649013 RepID=UPI000B4CE857|nr:MULTISPECIES: GNAT family N-acetyltransferase [unclassified Cryobacterium]ASD21851.1 GNAT family N-acetyltransferase [Cryobacterium sp. LW097]TFC53574.1 GNAT family N-acetyltransferase [Cryobacterium sp. TMB3-1-2]TFC59276.1 GNAT family N-acetyltransferase [Cryobacterium sp. TMB1-7]TFC69239.1 GNAT family N-acetyltransferase [Cryobacterium sp. TMB3-15]TFC75963.1 GNAT family N-acetyltransferase [Cryobacterium sp. TMB3-10]
MTATLPQVSLRPFLDTDSAQVLALNSAAVPAVNDLDADALAALIIASHSAIVVVADAEPDTVLGFAILFAAGADYASENYRFFSGRARTFLYVDRIVVTAGHRGRGLGARLYAAVFDTARALPADVVFCEVNLRPANPESLAFHGRLGFTEIGQQATKNDTVVVSLLSAAVPKVRSASGR